MKTLTRKGIILALIVFAAVSSVTAQRTIKGTVYMDGEPAAGVTVEAHKGSSMMTSFDGKYTVEADAKSKYLRFTLMATGESKKFDLDEQSLGVIDFAFTGSIPGAEGSLEDVVSGDIVLKTAEELLNEQDKDFMNELSLYTEFYKQEDYKSAMPHWRKLYNKYPQSTSNIYIHGAKMYEWFLDNAKTDEERDEWLQKYMDLGDQRIKYFGGRGYVLGRKGTTWLKYKLDENREAPLEGEALTRALQTGYDWLSTSIELQKEETELPVFLLLMQTSRSLFKMNAMEKEKVVSNYDKCNLYLDQIAENTTEKQTLDDIVTVKEYIENLSSTSGAADCETLFRVFTPQFEERNDDIEFIKSMLRRLRRAKCDNNPLVEKATVRLYELEPSAEAAFNMARDYLKKDNMEMTKKYYQQAIDQETDPKLLATYYYERGLLLYIKESNYMEAREMAKKALSLDPDLCDAYMLIGDVYSAASRSFQGSNLEKSAIFWVAVDYYNKARRGEDCSIDAAKKASDYKKYFPNKEDAFMEGLQEGQSYKVGGWINETTTVRF
jgi:tetratricopeptide (TPR) repeat protein